MTCSRKHFLWATVLAVCVSNVASRSFMFIQSPTLEEVEFLRKYGYMESDQVGLGFTFSASSVAEPVRRLQEFAGLPQTGILDPQTRQLFHMKRCGVKDIDNTSSRNRRYIVQQGWTKRTITYRVINGPSTFPKHRVESLMEAALAIWAPYGGLTFSRVDDGNADIKVSFVREDHGDGFPFDGPGHVVAHAFQPPHGEMHFDDDEVWGEDLGDEELDVTEFFAVAVHEIGHALGLSHSSVRASVMYPFYQVPVERLHLDDILGMRELYFQNDLSNEVAFEAVTEGPRRPSSAATEGPRQTSSAATERPRRRSKATTQRPRRRLTGKPQRPRRRWKTTTQGPRRTSTVTTGSPRRPLTVATESTRWPSTATTEDPRQISSVATVGLELPSTVGSRWPQTAATEAPTRALTTPRFTPVGDDDNEIPDLCYTYYNTLQVIKGKLFVFEEEWMWVIQNKVIEPGYPRRFHEVFRGLPRYVKTVNTIYEKQNGNIVIFSGRKYWEFDPTFRLHKVGRLTDYSLPRSLRELTTVFLSNFNNKTYLIDEERFWRYDEAARAMDRGYPRDMAAWRDVPAPVDAAVVWKGDTYFFRGPRFWRFDNTEVRAHRYYPLPTAQVWLPCAETADMPRYFVNEEP